MMPTHEWTLAVAGDGVRAIIRTPEASSSQPALLIYLTLHAERGLDDEPYAILPRTVLAAGHSVASFDLPHHGRLRGELGEGLTGMAAAFAAGQRVFDSAVATGSALIDAWLARTPRAGPVLIAGVSRGGLIALHLYAAEPRMTACAAFAPVTDLLRLREFAGLAGSPLVRESSALALAPDLRDRPLFLTINEQDDRVSTAACVTFFNAVRAASKDANRQALRIDPGSGHTVSETAYLAGAAWLLRYAEST